MTFSSWILASRSSLVYFLSLILIGHTQALCNAPWVRRPGEDSCYLFNDTQALNWNDARQLCRQNGGFLVSINSRDEESYLAGRLSTSKTERFWIGASDADIEMGWAWDDSSPFSYFNWASGQPDNHRDQDYVYLNTATMQWSDTGGDIVAGTVCETKVTDNSTMITVTTLQPKPQVGKFYGCDSGWVSHENSCYLILQEKKTWSDAQMVCRLNGAELASISTDLQNQFVWSQVPYGCHDKNSSCPELQRKGLCPEDGAYMSVNCRKSCGLCDSACANAYSTKTCDYWASIGECTKNPFWMWPNCRLSCGCDRSINEGYWIGLNDRSTSMNFVWSDLSPVTFVQWMRQEPNNFRGNAEENCVLMHASTGEWSNEVCDTPSSGFVCEKPKAFMDQRTIDASAMGCPFGSIGYDGKCFTKATFSKTWPDAKAYCERIKGRLAVIQDKRTNAFLASVLLSEDKSATYWVGLSASGESYSWVDDSKPEFAAWTTNHTGKEQDMCVTLTDRGWDPLPCDSSLPFVCEKARRGWATTTTTTPTPAVIDTANSTLPCPSGWTGFNDYCYKYMLRQQTWSTAQAMCERQAASLMTLHDQATHDLLFNTILQTRVGGSDGGEVWIGLRDHVGTDSPGYVWVDGTALDFQAWADNQPNSFTIVKACGVALTGSQKWKISSCFERKPFVCQLKRGGLFVTLIPTQGTTFKDKTTGLGSDLPLCRERKATVDPDKVGRFDPDTLGIDVVREPNAKTASSKADKARCDGMPKGWIAGIAVAVISGCAVLISAAFVYGKRRGSSWQHQNGNMASGSSGFDNALYAASQRENGHDDVKMSMDELNVAETL